MGFFLCAYYIKLFFWLSFTIASEYETFELNIQLKLPFRVYAFSSKECSIWTEATKTGVECTHELLIHIKVWPYIQARDAKWLKLRG